MSSPERGMELPTGGDVGQVDPVATDWEDIHIQRGQWPAILLAQQREEGLTYGQRPLRNLQADFSETQGNLRHTELPHMKFTCPSQSFGHHLR